MEGKDAKGAAAIVPQTFSLIDRSAPARVSTRLSFTTAVAGGSHSCGRTKSVGLYCWGFNVVGQLGDGTMTNSAEPVRVADQP